jgi:glutathione S-transferase
MIKLYGVAGSRAGRCLWMLEELGVEFEHVPTSFLGDQKKPEYLALNPNGHIPTLEDEGLVLWESMAINLYLAEKYGKGTLWPESEADRAHTLKWSFWVMTEVEPPLMQVMMNRAILPQDKRDPKRAERGERNLAKPLGILEASLEGRDFLLGGAFSTADLNVASVLAWAPSLAQVDMSPWPNASRWLAACTSRAAMVKVMAG